MLIILMVSCTREWDHTSSLFTLNPDLSLNLCRLLHRRHDHWWWTLNNSGCCCVSVRCFDLRSPIFILIWSLISNNVFLYLSAKLIAIHVLMGTFLLVYGLKGLIFVALVVIFICIDIIQVIMRNKRLNLHDITRLSSLDFSFLSLSHLWWWSPLYLSFFRWRFSHRCFTCLCFLALWGGRSKWFHWLRVLGDSRAL